jgi:hypothetical protein
MEVKGINRNDSAFLYDWEEMKKKVVSGAETENMP